jgi:3-keto-disaccharide hydrolase
MRNVRLLAVLLAVAGLLSLASAVPAADEGGFTKLFNGKDLTGFKLFPENAEATFQVKDGAIAVTGKPAGYFYTEKSYKNYVVKYDWMYTRPADLSDEEKFNGNSGCLVHIQTPHKVWPKSIEVQGMNKNHGQMIAVSGAPMTGAKDDPAARKTARKPVGQWNTTEVTVQEGMISAKINGTPISECRTTLMEGPIGWQSEGAEIHFKNIMIKELR